MTAGPGVFVWQVRPQDTKTLASLGHLLLTRNVTLDDEQADDTFKDGESRATTLVLGTDPRV